MPMSLSRPYKRNVIPSTMTVEAKRYSCPEWLVKVSGNQSKEVIWCGKIFCVFWRFFVCVVVCCFCIFNFQFWILNSWSTERPLNSYSTDESYGYDVERKVRHRKSVHWSRFSTISVPLYVTVTKQDCSLHHTFFLLFFTHTHTDTKYFHRLLSHNHDRWSGWKALFWTVLAQRHQSQLPARMQALSETRANLIPTVEGRDYQTENFEILPWRRHSSTLNGHATQAVLTTETVVIRLDLFNLLWNFGINFGESCIRRHRHHLSERQR